MREVHTLKRVVMYWREEPSVKRVHLPPRLGPVCC